MANKPTNILYYIPNLKQDSGGIRQYAAALMRLFIQMPDNYRFFIYHDGQDPVILDALSENKKLIHVNAQIPLQTEHDRRIYTYKSRLARVVNKVFRSAISVTLRNEFDYVIDTYDIDIVHCPFQFLPYVIHANKKGVKQITTMHDVQELHFPEFFTPEERAYRAVHYMHFIKDADRVVVSYQHVKDDLIKYFRKDPNDIYVMLLKMDNLWFKKHEHTPLKKLPPYGKFLFYAANFWKHKNHINLLKAISYLKTNRNCIIRLVLTGEINSSGGAAVLEYIKKEKLESQITIAGIVDEHTLYSLYKNTHAVVVPTLYEAGSFPLVESILMEIPVICSNVTSLPETIGDEQFIFDPNSIESIADKLEKIWNDELYRTAAKDNTKKQQARLIETHATSILNTIYTF